jgi:hypothetical protein
MSLNRPSLRCLISLTPHGKERGERERASDWDILKKDEEMERAGGGGGGCHALGGGVQEVGGG